MQALQDRIRHCIWKPRFERIARFVIALETEGAIK